MPPKASTKKPATKGKKKTPARKHSSDRRQLFIAHYLDRDEPTFLNATKAAIKAGYAESTATKWGSQLRRDCEAEISAWMDSAGVSKTVLMEKLLQLLNATETKFFSYEGRVTDVREVACLGIQIKALELAMRARGMLTADNTEQCAPVFYLPRIHPDEPIPRPPIDVELE